MLFVNGLVDDLFCLRVLIRLMDTVRGGSSWFYAFIQLQYIFASIAECSERLKVKYSAKSSRDDFVILSLQKVKQQAD